MGYERHPLGLLDTGFSIVYGIKDTMVDQLMQLGNYSWWQESTRVEVLFGRDSTGLAFFSFSFWVPVYSEQRVRNQLL